MLGTHVAAEFLGFILLGGFGLLLLAWIGSVDRSDREPAGDTQNGVMSPCRRCHHLNPTHARFCARCGCAVE